MPSTTKNKCKCGRDIPHRSNSTIQSKLCPKCSYEEVLKRPRKSPQARRGTISGKLRDNKFNLYRSSAWRWCSRYVLLYYSDKNLMVQCSTSPELIYHVTDKRIQCGHYIKVKDGNSSNYATALEFTNLAPQSLRDNRYMSGKPDIMRNWLIKKHGEEEIKMLEIKKRNVCKLDPVSLEVWAEEYKAKFKNLLKQRNIKNPWNHE